MQSDLHFDVTGGRLSGIQSIVIIKDKSTAEGALSLNADKNVWTAIFQTDKLTIDGAYDISFKTTSNDNAVSTGKQVNVTGTTH